AVSCAFSAGDYNSPLVKEWLKFCQKNIPLSQSAGMARFGHDEYVHYYFAQTLYMLGDDGYAKLFPNSREGERLTWSKYRKDAFANLKATQNPDGSWGGNYGPVYNTATRLAILQLDNATLPIYQR